MRNFIPERLRSDKTALFLDVDGTMLDFAGKPSEVLVPADLVSNIDALERGLGGALALVSGRTIADLDLLFQPLRLRASGVHGAEIRHDPTQARPTVEEASVLGPALWRSLNETLAAIPGTFLENKRFSFTIHYRAEPDLGPVLRETLREFVAAHGDEKLELLDAHLAYEIKGANFDKGWAIDKLLERHPFLGRVPMYIGDDWTDEAGFAAVVRHGGTAYSVGERRPLVSGVFSGPQMVREWLGQEAARVALS